MLTVEARVESNRRRLSDMLAGIADREQLAFLGDRVASGVFDDSRRVEPGSIFVAIRGWREDGRRYVSDAIARGAAVIVGEDLPTGAGLDGGAIAARVPDARAALTVLALRWYGLADDGCGGLKLLGVTGTNGKSTTAFMVRAILRAAGLRSGMLGTVQYDLCGRSVTAGMTTPGPLELAAYLRECADAGAAAAVMEVSSHALDQKRTDGLRFAAAAFTNLSGDHLDYHASFENYRDAKTRLFAGLASDAVAVVNRDDPNHEYMLRGCAARRIMFAMEAEADIVGRITRSTSAGTFYRLRVGGVDLVLENALVGRHNVYNAMTAAGLAWAIGVPVDAIAAGLMSVRNVPGRLQRVPCALQADVFVDYAHTDDALRNVLTALRPLTRGRLIVVFGCGGDRDRTKRPRMAQVAAACADHVVVTSDNPRTEEPQRIIDDILAGFAPEQLGRVEVDADRAGGIRLALSRAVAGDVVLIAGKGHENYQILKDRRIHFDDVEVAIQMAAELTSGGGRGERVAP